MTAEVQRRGLIRPITDLPPLATTDGVTFEGEKNGLFYAVPGSVMGGGDPALAPLGTEVAAYSDEFETIPAGWTWLNQGTSTVQAWQSRAVLTPQLGGAGVNNLRLWGPPTFPAAPWCARIRMLDWATLADVGGGFFAYRTANSRIHTPNISLRASVSTGVNFTENWAVNDWSSFTALNATRYGPTVNDVRSRDRYFQFRCDGTTLFFDASVDNAIFWNVTSTALATYLGGEPDRVGVVGNNPTATAGQMVGYDWFRVYANASLNQGP